jgi:hypothetical protein
MLWQALGEIEQCDDVTTSNQSHFKRTRLYCSNIALVDPISIVN